MQGSNFRSKFVFFRRAWGYVAKTCGALVKVLLTVLLQKLFKDKISWEMGADYAATPKIWVVSSIGGSVAKSF